MTFEVCSSTSISCKALELFLLAALSVAYGFKSTFAQAPTLVLASYWTCYNGGYLIEMAPSKPVVYLNYEGTDLSREGDGGVAKCVYNISVTDPIQFKGDLCVSTDPMTFEMRHLTCGTLLEYKIYPSGKTYSCVDFPMCVSSFSMATVTYRQLSYRPSQGRSTTINLKLYLTEQNHLGRATTSKVMPGYNMTSEVEKDGSGSLVFLTSWWFICLCIVGVIFIFVLGFRISHTCTEEKSNANSTTETMPLEPTNTSTPGAQPFSSSVGAPGGGHPQPNPSVAREGVAHHQHHVHWAPPPSTTRGSIPPSYRRAQQLRPTVDGPQHDQYSQPPPFDFKMCGTQHGQASQPFSEGSQQQYSEYNQQPSPTFGASRPEQPWQPPTPSSGTTPTAPPAFPVMYDDDPPPPYPPPEYPGTWMS